MKKKTTIIITKAIVSLKNKEDEITLLLDKPSPWSENTPNYLEPLRIEFKVESDNGIEYLKKNFGIKEKDIKVYDERRYRCWYSGIQKK